MAQPPTRPVGIFSATMFQQASTLAKIAVVAEQIPWDAIIWCRQYATVCYSMTMTMVKYIVIIYYNIYSIYIYIVYIYKYIYIYTIW